MVTIMEVLTINGGANHKWRTGANHNGGLVLTIMEDWC